MKILDSLKSGAISSVRAWKEILLICILTLFIVGMVALPLKSGIKSMLGDSMVTELLTGGVNLDVLSDSVANIRTIFSLFSSGFLMLMLTGFILNVFLTGGLFSILRKSEELPSVRLFFDGCISNFWSFLVILFFDSLMIIALTLIVVGVPLIITTSGGTPAEGAMLNTFRSFAIVFAFILPVFILVVDYARAWQVTNDKKAGFKALGFGFRLTFKTFISSYPLMLILVAFQVLYGVLIISKLLLWTPVTGGGVFLLFLLSQLLFVIKVLLRTWRYGSITSLMEKSI
jgi:hypothetical protein